jgi:hypothetical protein
MTMGAKAETKWGGSDLLGFRRSKGRAYAEVWHTRKGAGYRVNVRYKGFEELGYARYATNVDDAKRLAEAWLEREAQREAVSK